MSNSLIESFKPIFKISKVFGILSTPLTKYKPIYGYYYTIFIFIIITAEVFNNLFNVVTPIYKEYTVLQVTDYIELFCGYTTTVCFFYKSLTGRKKLLKIFNRLRKIDESFLLIEISFDYQKVPRRLKIQIVSASLSVFVVGILSDTSILFKFMVYYNLILCSNIIYQIYLKYKKINTFLLKIKNERSNVSLIYEATKLYEELNDVIKIVNNLFGLTNLMSIGK